MNADLTLPATGGSDALAVFNGTGDIDAALERLRGLLPSLVPWRAPPADVAILLTVLAATQPDAVPEDIGRLLASLIRRADLTRTAQPAVDETFQLLELLVATPAGAVLPDLASHVLRVPDLHPRWFRAALELLRSLDDWRPAAFSLDSLIATAERVPADRANALVHAIVGPLVLAEPAACDLAQLQRAVALLDEPSAARYVLNALAHHAATPPVVRDWAAATSSGRFPLRAVWQRLFGERGLRLLCVQNIADAQGDEIVRVAPLLQALLDDRPNTRVTLVTDRAYLYDHPRLDLISFDEPERIARALDERVDGLIEFFEVRAPHLNHDTDLARLIAAYRERTAPRFDLRAGKGWNRFTFDAVYIDGVPWESALRLNENLNESVYDPVYRLMAELGLPVSIGVRACAEPVLAHEAVLEHHDDTPSQRPIALLNPFGGSAALKGFVPWTFDDLVPRITTLIDEGYDVLICRHTANWGSRERIDDILAGLSVAHRRHVDIAPIPSGSTSPSAAMRSLVSLVAQADLVITIEGWMMHAAYVDGKPYRLLLMPASGERNWQPWGRARTQHVWYFQGNSSLERPPCPERPRRAAWLALLNRINDARWCDTLVAIAQSPDRDIRLAALGALGRLGQRTPRAYFTALLADPAWDVRALAAQVLLERYPATDDSQPDRQTLAGHRAIGLAPRDRWSAVANLGAAALPALWATLHDADPVMRREAAAVLERYRRAANDRGVKEEVTYEP